MNKLSLVQQMLVYLYLSIKSRIETERTFWGIIVKYEFISIYPSNQGLKLPDYFMDINRIILFISIYPSNQGLKHIEPLSVTTVESCLSLSIHQIKD